MTDSSVQEQRSQTERRMQQQKWQRFADNLRHSSDTTTENGVERTYDDSLNGLKSPVLSDEQQSDLGTDLAVDEKSSIAEDGFELVINKRNRSQRQKQVNGGVWTGAAAHLKELHSSSSSSANTANSGTSSTQSSTKLRVTPATNPSSKISAPATKNLTTKASPYGLIRCMEEGAAENEQDMSNSSDSAFAENQSPSHGSSTSLHFMGASENYNFSDSVVALSDDEKWPELGVVTRNEQKSNADPASPKIVEAKSTTPVDEKSNPLEKKKAQWKKVEIDINYGKPNEKKHGSSRKNNFRDDGPKRQNANGKRRPQSRKSNVSSSDVEAQNNNEKAEIQDKTENGDSQNEKFNNHRQSNQAENHQSYGRRENKQNDGRNYRNNGNNFRSDQYNDYNRRQIRNPRVSRHSVPNLFQCQTTVPVYFLSHEYAPENFIQPLGSAPAAQPFIYPTMTNMIVPATFSDMSYANAQFMNEYQQTMFQQYRSPFVQMPMMPQNAPFVNTGMPTTIPESSISESSPADQNSSGQSLDEELSQLLRKVFIDANDKSLRDLTDDQNIIAHLNYNERCLILRCQMQFYFSPDNLAKDVFLRSHMDNEGFAPLGLFTKFPRIKNLALDHNGIVTSLLNSENFELKINEQEVKVRAKELPQIWTSGNSLTSQPTPPSTVQSPQQVDSQQKRPSQVDVDEISVDDVRARLMSRSRHSPSSTENPQETIPELPSTPASQSGEPEDEWVVYKKKNRQPSSNGSVTAHEPENKPSSKPTGKTNTDSKPSHNVRQ